jgi:hypothetical protein
MPSPTTALELIKGAMRLIGAIATGETLTADETTDGLKALNDLLENWSVEKLSVWQRVNETFNAVAGQVTYTIGPTGTWVTTRPVRINDAYCTVNGEDFPVDVINQQQYNDIAVKNQQSSIVERLLYLNTNANGTVTLWPVPQETAAVTLSMDTLLTNITDVNTSLSYPPGYAKALRYSLAVELAAEFGVQASPSVLQIAQDCKADIKRANKVPVRAAYDGLLTGGLGDSYDRGY